MNNKLDYQSNINHTSSEVTSYQIVHPINTKKGGGGNEMWKYVGKRIGRMYSYSEYFQMVLFNVTYLREMVKLSKAGIC